MKLNKTAVAWILSGIAAAGTFGTAVLAVIKTPEAVEKIKEDSMKHHDGDAHAYTKTEAVKSAWKYYIPAAAAGIATTACIFGAGVLNAKQQKSMAGAYALVADAYNKYTAKVKERYGIEEHERILAEIGAEKCEEQHITAGLFGNSCCLDFDTEEKKRIFYDTISGRYFETTVPKVLEAEYHLNRNYTLRGEASLSEFYEFLGLEDDHDGVDPFWEVDGDEIYWIEFDHSKGTLTNGEEFFIIDYPFPPKLTSSYDAE